MGGDGGSMEGWGGVSASFTARHLDPIMDEGEHEHTWTVTAWYPLEPFRDLRAQKTGLEEVLRAWPDAMGRLPDRLWSADQMARDLLQVLANCVGVDISRPEGFRAKVRARP